jgi:ATP-binding cassette subfamily F protein uup
MQSLRSEPRKPMAIILTCQSLTKSYSSRPLFEDISLAIEEDDTIGLIGPNGSGKSTLLKVLCGMVEPDTGSVTVRRALRIAYLEQQDSFDPQLTIKEVVANALAGTAFDEITRTTKVEVILSKMGFTAVNLKVAELSGGWRKRLAIATKLVLEPDLLLLDEPTNHLDLEGVLWLEQFLRSASIPFILVTHDRCFLENTTNRTIELNRLYRDGYLSIKGAYSQFLEARENYVAAQAHEQQALASKVRREIAWLQRGARARQTKSQARIRDAGKLIDGLEEVKARNAASARADVDFSASGRKTRELINCTGIGKTLSDKKLFSNLDIVLCPGDKLGLLGANGSGKTTLLRILAGQLDADTGKIKRADNLKVVWFDQNREQLNQELSLKESLCPEGDSVVYRGQSVHVASWSRRFLFRPDQLNMPISYLSGGEQARILIARLMLVPADILILDEPTNDLDIGTLEVLEESLEDFPGAVVLVTHDRLMLDTISTNLLALDGQGAARYFADYAQWESSAAEELTKQAKRPAKGETKSTVRLEEKKQLSTSEKKELAAMPERIEQAELSVDEIKKRMDHPAVASDHVQLESLMNELKLAQDALDRLYYRWQDLEARLLQQNAESQKI